MQSKDVTGIFLGYDYSREYSLAIFKTNGEKQARLSP